MVTAPTRRPHCCVRTRTPRPCGATPLPRTSKTRSDQSRGPGSGHVRSSRKEGGRGSHAGGRVWTTIIPCRHFSQGKLGFPARGEGTRDQIIRRCLPSGSLPHGYIHGGGMVTLFTPWSYWLGAPDAAAHAHPFSSSWRPLLTPRRSGRVRGMRPVFSGRQPRHHP